MNDKDHFLNPDFRDVPGYDPEALFALVMNHLGFTSKYKFCKEYGVAPAVMSKIKHRKMALSPQLLLLFHEITGIELDRLRKVAGIPPFLKRGGHVQRSDYRDQHVGESEQADNLGQPNA